MQEKITLIPDYYLHNFKFVVDWVGDRYGDLLNDAERYFIQAFNQLPCNAQCLLVRLSSRKGPYFRENKLHYSEIGLPEEAAAHLHVCGLLQVNPVLSVVELSEILTKAELVNLFNCELSSIKQERKELLVEKLATEFFDARRWNQWTQGKQGELYYWDHQQTLNTIKLLFFGNSYQDLTEFVLQDLGLYQYENYTIDKQHRLFKHRDEIEQYWLINRLREQFEIVTTIEEVVQLAHCLPEQALTPLLGRRLVKLTNQMAYWLEMNGEHEIALKLYQTNNHPPARERRIRLFEKLGQFYTAWQELESIKQQPINEQELQIIERMAPRLAKKSGSPCTKKPENKIIENRIGLPRVFTDEAVPLAVEEVAQQYFNQTNNTCFYVENLLFNSLFGLWLWPEIFRGVEGAFVNPFQIAPLDMYQENFVANRQGLTESWAMLDKEHYAEHFIDIWQQKTGIANHWVSWDLDPEIIQHALDLIPVIHLKRIFERILFDPKSNRSGFPDLIQFFPAQKTYRLIEIKGPGDRLQDNQIRWLHYFNQQGIAAEVCYVDWT